MMVETIRKLSKEKGFTKALGLDMYVMLLVCGALSFIIMLVLGFNGVIVSATVQELIVSFLYIMLAFAVVTTTTLIMLVVLGFSMPFLRDLSWGLCRIGFLFTAKYLRERNEVDEDELIT